MRKQKLISALLLSAALIVPGPGDVISGVFTQATADPGSGRDGTPKVDDKIEDDVEDKLEDKLEDEIEDEVEDDIEDEIEENVESDIEDGVEDDIESEVEDSVEDTIEDDVESNVEDGVSETVETRVEENVADRIDERVEDNSGPGSSDDRDIEDAIEDRVEADIEDRSGRRSGESVVDSQVEDDLDDRSGSRAGDDIADIERDLARMELDAAEDAADAARDAMRAEARATRDAALLLPGADEDAIRAAYDAAIEAADEARDASKETAKITYKSSLEVIEATEDAYKNLSSGSSGSSNSGSGASNSGSGSSNSGSGKDDDEDEDEDDDSNSGHGSSNSNSGSGASSAARVFNIDFDENGHEIERGELLMIASRGDLENVIARGLAARELKSLDHLGLVLARIDANGRSLSDTEAAIRNAAPNAEVDYNHVYRRHRETLASKRDNSPNDKTEEDSPNDKSNGVYRPDTERRDKSLRLGATPTELMDLSVPDRGAGRTIGLIDTRVDANHAALRSAQLQQVDFVPYAHQKPNAHGTSVASILAGDTEGYHGLLPMASVYAASVFFSDPTGGEAATTESLVEALYWMTEKNVPVVNMSLTGPPNAILKRAIDQAYTQGTIVVAAVGNDGPSAGPLYPAAYENVIGVTAVDQKNRVYRLANRGVYVDFAAPGVDIRHADDDGAFAASSGTSMATPFVAAVIAAASDENGKISEDRLRLLAQNAIDLGKKGFDPVYGYGLIQPVVNK